MALAATPSRAAASVTGEGDDRPMALLREEVRSTLGDGREVVVRSATPRDARRVRELLDAVAAEPGAVRPPRPRSTRPPRLEASHRRVPARRREPVRGRRGRRPAGLCRRAPPRPAPRRRARATARHVGRARVPAAGRRLPRHGGSDGLGARPRCRQGRARRVPAERGRDRLLPELRLRRRGVPSRPLRAR